MQHDRPTEPTSRPADFLRDTPLPITLLGLLFLLECALFLFPVWNYCGDEGFFALAARNALRGLRPYRDFLFIQMPLLPYAYAAWFTVAPISIQSGRVFATLLGTGGVLLSLFTCRRLGGQRAAVFAGMLWVSSIHVAADFSTIKTQSLCHLLICASLYCVARSLQATELRWVAGAMAFMSLAFLTRLTLVIPLVLLWGFLAWENRRRLVPYLALVATNISIIAACFWFFWADGRMWFDIYVTHRDFYGAAPWTWPRLFWTIKGWLGNQLVIAACFGFAMIDFAIRAIERRNWAQLRFPAFILACYWGVCLAHWVQVQNYPTHHSTITAFAIIFTALILQPLLDGLRADKLRLANLAFGLACLMSLPFNEIDPAVRLARVGKPAMFDEAVNIVRKHIQPGDRLLSFNVELAVEGGFDVYPGCDMSDWNYMAGVSDEVADRYRLLNLSKLKAAIRDGDTPILTLVDRDFQIMAAGNPDIARELKTLIDDHFHNVGVVKRYGMFQQDLFIFKRLRPATGPAAGNSR